MSKKFENRWNSECMYTCITRRHEQWYIHTTGWRRVNRTRPIYFCCPSSVFLQQNMFHDALNWSTWYSRFTWNFSWRLTWAWLTFLTANEFNIVWRTNRSRSTGRLLLLSVLPVLSILLIKSFKVLCFHRLEWNSFDLGVPHPFSTRNTRNNTLSSLVNGHVFIFIYIYNVGRKKEPTYFCL